MSYSNYSNDNDGDSTVSKSESVSQDSKTTTPEIDEDSKVYWSDIAEWNAESEKEKREMELDEQEQQDRGISLFDLFF